MRYLEFRELLKDWTVFSLSDIKRLNATFHRRRLTEWQEKGYVKKLIKGYYIFSDLTLKEDVIFEIANRIYKPSYISFETAFAYYGLIPESVYGITSASTRRTYKFKTPIGEFSYRTLAPRLFFGYEIIKYNSKCFKMASLEKAILDYFYLNSHIKEKEDFISMRLNKEILLKKTNWKKMEKFLKIYGRQSLSQRIGILQEVIKDA
jgi:predicted transcriptional regulator of viral defense system